VLSQFCIFCTLAHPKLSPGSTTLYTNDCVSRSIGVLGRHGHGGRGERHDGGVDVCPLARSPPAQLTVHGRRAVRDTVSGSAAQFVPVRVPSRQRGHALLALAFRLPAG